MAKCRYCKEKAGLFKDSHDECWSAAQNARKTLGSFVAEAVKGVTPNDTFHKSIQEIREKGRLNEADERDTIRNAANKASYDLALQNPIDNADAQRIGELFKLIEPSFFEDTAVLLKYDGYIALLHSNTIYQILHNEIPYCEPELYNVFRLDRDEHPILKRGVVLAENRAISSGGTYQSVGVPLGGGIYYRIGASAPRTQQIGLVQVDQGTMLLSTEAIYFSGQQTTFRIPYRQVLRLESFSDGIGIHENHGRGKVFIPFKLGEAEEGWYFYNLISALAARAG